MIIFQGSRIKIGLRLRGGIAFEWERALCRKTDSEDKCAGHLYKLAAEISHGWAEFIPRPLLCRFRTAIQILCENLDCKSERFSVESHRLMKAFFLVSMIWATSCSFAVDALDVWSLRYSGNRDLRFVRYTGGLFIAGGEGGRIVTSPDGLNWSQQTANTNTLLSAATSDGFSNFVAVGQTRTPLPCSRCFPLLGWEVLERA